MNQPADRPASAPRFEVDVAWDVRIRARDGVELSANLWRPVSDTPVPAILEMIPYGKDNWRRAADMAHGTYFAARGYALCRVDVRGTGSSFGIALDEYTADETRDGYDVVEWLAAQPWCDGNVGMWGISYGGFTAIQVAALRPPHLRAIVPGGRRLYAAETLRMTAWDDDPARAELDARVVYRWQEREVGRYGELTGIEIRAASRQTSTATDFDLTVRLGVDVDGEPFFQREWHETIPRHLV
jgi:pimeloyl-ACP methyl ester carboxylesterase